MKPNPNPIPNPIYPCGCCNKKVNPRNKAMQCDICNYFNHIRCDGISAYDYEKMKKINDTPGLELSHICKICKEEIFPFQCLSEDEFLTSIIKNIDYNKDLNLKITPPTDLKRLFTDFSGHSEDESSPVNCEYYDVTSPKILKDIDPNNDIKLPGYLQYSTPTESSKGGVMIYYKEGFIKFERKNTSIILGFITT